MGSFLLIILMFWSIGLLLSLSAHIYWSTNGKFMLATGAIASVSAYSSIILANNNYPFLLSFSFSIFLGILIGGIFSAIGQKISSEDFILMSLVGIEIIRRLEFHFINLTKGAYGIRIEFNESSVLFSNADYIKIVIVLISICILFVINKFYNSYIGLKWRIVGKSSLGAQNLGINSIRTEKIAGCVAGSIAAIAGVSYSYGIGYLHPNDLSIDIGLIALASAIAIKTKSFLIRVVIITFILFVSREFLRLINIGGASRFGFFDCFIGLLIIFFSIKMAKFKK